MLSPSSLYFPHSTGLVIIFMTAISLKLNEALILNHGLKQGGHGVGPLASGAASGSRAGGAPCRAVCSTLPLWEMVKTDVLSWCGAKGQCMWEGQLSLWHVGELFLCSSLQFLTALPKGDWKKNWQPVRKRKILPFLHLYFYKAEERYFGSGKGWK